MAARVRSAIHAHFRPIHAERFRRRDQETTRDAARAGTV